MSKSHRLKQKLLGRNINNRANDFSGAYCLRFQRLNWIQQTLATHDKEK